MGAVHRLKLQSVIVIVILHLILLLQTNLQSQIFIISHCEDRIFLYLSIILLIIVYPFSYVTESD